MNVDSIAAIAPPTAPAFETIESGAGLPGGVGRPGGDFAAWFDRQLDELNRQLNTSDTELRKLATGETNNIHHVMLSLEKAKLSFQLMLQVRNKALEAYQDVMRMQL